MRQQINLYQPTFSEGRKPLSAGTALACLIVLVGVLGAVSIAAHARVRKLALEVDSLRAQQMEQENALNAAPQESGESIEEQMKRLERAVDERSRALEILRSGAAGRTVGFAPRLEALARRHVDGLWIDALQLSGTSTAMTVSGSTLDPDIVPAFLRSLAKDDVLAGTRFDDFIILRPTEQTADGESEPKKRKRYDPRLVRFKAGSSALGRSAESEASS